ncbi:MAG: O-antigen ligase family protein [Spirulina sp. SIO3F2]|nr:O-antigen ligase family protein [Spirulina sp. SIO3F2]
MAIRFPEHSQQTQAPTPTSTVVNPAPLWQWQSFQLGLLVFFGLPSLGAVLLGISKLGLIGRFWHQWRRQPLVQVWGILFVLMLGGSAMAIAPLDALLGMANIIPFGLLVTALIYLIRTPTQLWRISQIMLIAGSPMLLLGLGQLFGDWSTPTWLNSLLGWSLIAGGNPPGRMAAMLMYANLFACYLLVLLCLAGGLWLTVYRQWQQQPTPTLGWQLAGLTLALLGNGTGVFLAHSRNAWALAVIAFLGFCLYLGWYWLVGLAVGGVGIVAWASWLPSWGGTVLRQVVPSILWSRLSGEMYPDEQTEILRSVQWRFCWQLIQERPLTGWGLRSFESLYNNGPHAVNHYHWVAHPHNVWMMLGAELGIPLTLALCVWGAWCCYPLVRRFWQFPVSDRPILFSYLLAFGMVCGFNLLDVSLFDFRTNCLGWLLLGVIAGIGRSALPSRSPQVEASTDLAL